MSASIPNPSFVSSTEPTTAHPQEQQPGGSRWQRTRDALPTFGVVVTLAVLAAWGHHTGWQLPRFSALLGRELPAAAAWCEDHNVLEAACIECRPELWPAPPDHGWCKTHGVANCPFEHAEMAQTASPVVVADAMRDQAARALALRPRSENNSRCASHQRRIQFASTAIIEQLEIGVAVVQEMPIVEGIVANGEIVYDPARVAHMASRVAGTAWRVEKQLGDQVAEGDILALIDAADVGRAKSELVRSISETRLKEATVERLRPLADQGVIPSKQLQQAEAEWQQARIELQAAQQVLNNFGMPIGIEELDAASTTEISNRIQFLGLPADLIARLSPSTTTSNLFPVRAPISGTVVEREVVEGEVLDTSTQLFTIADDKQMGLILNVRQEDAQYVNSGQRVTFRAIDNAAPLVGTVRWVSTTTDERTRTVEVRAELPNEVGQLRSNTFGAGQIILREGASAIVVPDAAIHWDGCCHIVFVRDKDYFRADAPKFFHVRKVRLGVEQEGSTEIIAGLLPGEVIATSNSVVLEAQLLKANLGAGCCEACAPKKND